MAKIINVCKDKNGYARSVQMYIGNSEWNALVSRVLVGATNIEDCFVGRIKQIGPITNRGATLNGQENHRWSWEEPVAHESDSHVCSLSGSYIGP